MTTQFYYHPRNSHIYLKKKKKGMQRICSCLVGGFTLWLASSWIKVTFNPRPPQKSHFHWKRKGNTFLNFFLLFPCIDERKGAKHHNWYGNAFPKKNGHIKKKKKKKKTRKKKKNRNPRPKHLKQKNH